jgi:hypothetical protein
MIDANELERAKAYAESIVWRLETLQSRSRYNTDTGELKRLPTKLRRFSNGIPQDNVASTLIALAAMAPYRGMIYNGEDDLDHEYRPTVTLIRKDNSLRSGGDASYTIIQDLLLTGELDIYSAGDSSSCSQISETEWHWDEGEITECPQGGQGVSYRIENVSRSAENDLFSYAVRKTQAVTQHLPATTVACSDNSFTTVETWDNVYGEPGAFRWDSVAHGGEPLDIPNPCTGIRGLLIKLQVQENPDCTFRVSVERTTSKVGDGDEYMRYRDQYKIQSIDLVSRAPTPLPKTGVEYSGGVMTKYEVRKNEDGTYENRTTTETEREVPSSTVLRSVMPYRARVERTDTNAASPASGLLPGFVYGSYESIKTPGGLFTNRYVGIENLQMDLGHGCKKTAFQHDHSTEETVKTLPAVSHVVEAGGGKVSEIRYRTDGEGTIVKSSTETQEIQESGSAGGTTLTARYRIVKRTDTNVASRASSLLSGFQYGSFQYHMTPGKWFVNEYIGYEARKLDVMRAHTADKFRHEDVVENTADGLPTISHTSAAGGVITTDEARLDENGVATVVHKTVKELSVPSSTKEVIKTPRAIITRLTDTNMTARATALLSGKFGTFKYTTTPGGLFVNEYLSVEMNPGAKSVKSRMRDAFREEHVDAVSKDDLSAVPEHVVEANDGVITKMDGHVDDQGVVTVTTTEVKELNVDNAEVKLVRTPRGVIKTVKHRNAKGKPASQLASQVSSFKNKIPGSVEERTTNPGRTTDVVETEFEPVKGLKTSDACQVTSTEHTHKKSEVLEANAPVKANDQAKAGGGKHSSEEVVIKEDGAKVRETVEVTEHNKVYGSRIHEDALQSYRVVDKTSDPTNIGDANHNSNLGDASHSAGGSSGSASDLQKLQKFETKEAKVSYTNKDNTGATIAISGDLTLNPVAPQSGFKRGVHVDQDSELTKGGRFRTKDYQFVARPHKWRDFIKMEHYVHLKWTFRNLTAEDIDPLVKEVVDEAARYSYGTFTVRPDINRTINDFGLYDGTVSFVASSPANVGSGTTGKRQIPEAEKTPATEIEDWWEKSMSIVPVTPLNPIEYTGTAWFRVNVEWRHLEQGWGRGEQEYKNFIQQNNQSFWADSRHSYNVESQLFTYTKVLERKVYVYLQKGKAVSTSSTEPVLDSAAVNSLSENNRDSTQLGE